MNNLSSYCGLVDAKISASDKDLPVIVALKTLNSILALKTVNSILVMKTSIYLVTYLTV